MSGLVSYGVKLELTRKTRHHTGCGMVDHSGRDLDR